MRARCARIAPRMTTGRRSARIRGLRHGTAVATWVSGTGLMDQQRFRPSAAVRASISGDGLVLLDVDGGLVLSSNAVGARIWQLLEQEQTAGEIARQLAGDYAVPVERADRDVATFIAALAARGLVTGDPRR
jgi:hypothetical protein